MRGSLRLTIAVVFAALFLVVLLALLALSQFGEDSLLDEQLVVREVALAPPPPPPPKSVTQTKTDSAQSVQIDAGAYQGHVQIVMGSADVDALPEPVRPQLDSVHSNDWSFDWSADLQTFGLGELDTRPRLLAPLRVDFPDALRRRGIKKASAKLHVVIDERGAVSLKAINYLQYAELKAGVIAAARMARFSAPTKDGQAVRAEFLWPVELVSGGR